MMLYVFNCWNISTPEAAAHSASLFQTGWFVESLLTQTLIIHVIRTNKIPFLQSRPSWLVTVMSALIMAVGVVDPVLAVGPLPRLHRRCRRSTGRSWRSRSLCYVLLTQGVKMFISWRKWI